VSFLRGTPLPPRGVFWRQLLYYDAASDSMCR
jgi:hypothetical protein